MKYAIGVIIFYTILILFLIIKGIKKSKHITISDKEYQEFIQDMEKQLQEKRNKKKK